jgi:hypothetical protein
MAASAYARSYWSTDRPVFVSLVGSRRLFLLGLGIAYRLGKDDLLVLAEAHGLGELLTIDITAHHGSEPGRCAVEIYVLAYEARIGGRIESLSAWDPRLILA